MSKVASPPMAQSTTPSGITVLIQARIDAKGWTLTRFAEAAGISTSGLRKILRGQVAGVSSSTVRKLAKALGQRGKTGVQAVRAACGVALVSRSESSSET